MYRSYTLLVLSIMLSINTNAQFRLRNGDLLFSIGKSNSAMQAAIQNATAKPSEMPYTHVGIVYISNHSTFVIEATTPHGVQQVTLGEFMSEAASHNSKTYVAVGRLKNTNPRTIENALRTAQSKIGCAYDSVYNESNEAFYCSELVRKSFLTEDGSYLFPALEMTFKNQQTKQFDPYWLQHFNALNSPIPEGQPGSNPSQQAQSELIEIVHTYFNTKPSH